MISSRKLALVLCVLAALALYGCEISADKEDQHMPEVGYDTFKLFIDDIGPDEEIDHTGFPTGRRGFLFDSDRDGKGDSFYQISRPVGGVFGLTGEVSLTGLKAFALARFTAGEQNYEIPLDSLTSWVRVGATLGFKETRYIDELKTLVYLDRLTGEEMEAPLTGSRATISFDLQTLGTVTLGVDKVFKSTGRDDEEEAEIDYSAANSFELYGRCISKDRDDGAACSKKSDCDSSEVCYDGSCFEPDYLAVCDEMDAVGMFRSGWSLEDCMQNMFHYSLGDSSGVRYNNCLMKTCLDDDMSAGFADCVNYCRVEKLGDENGCYGESAPDIHDVVYLLKRGGQLFQGVDGVGLTGNDQLFVFLDYKDADCNFHRAGDDVYNIGQMVVTLTDGAGGGTTFTLPPREGGRGIDLGCDSLEDRQMIGFQFDGLADGNYTFTIKLKEFRIPKSSFTADKNPGNMSTEELGEYIADLEEDQDKRFRTGILCRKTGRAYEGSFVVTGHAGSSTPAQGPGSMSFEMLEVYDTGITKYTIGKGFIDAVVAGPGYLTNVDDFDLGYIFSQIWSWYGLENYGDEELWDSYSGLASQLNVPLTDTADTRKTKFDASDDIEAYVIYIDQYLSPGVFSFYGDAGWNVFSKGPSGNNRDQPFVWGSFEDTRITLRMKPFSPVDPQFTGCTVDAGYWADYLYDNTGLASKRALFQAEGDTSEKIQRIYSCRRIDALISDYFDGMDKETFLFELNRNSSDPYWNCRITCLNTLKNDDNGCYTIEQCLDQCPDEHMNSVPITLCEAGHDDLYLNVEVTIPEAFLASSTYAPMFSQPDPESCTPVNEGMTRCNADGDQVLTCNGTYYVPESECAVDRICNEGSCVPASCNEREECSLICSGSRVMECSQENWIIHEDCAQDGQTCMEGTCVNSWKPLRVGVCAQLTASGGECLGLPGASIPLVASGLTQYRIPLPYLPFVTSELTSQGYRAMSGGMSQFVVGIFDDEQNGYGFNFTPAKGEGDADQYYLLLWNQNWTTGVWEGWTLSIVEPPFIIDYFAPSEPTISIEFGKREALDAENLVP